MPVYLCRSFRWHRPAIRIHVILNNIDDAAPEWLVAPATSRALVENFRNSWPELLINLPNLRFIEQYDPNDETTKSQPYAYVADVVHEVKLGLDIGEILSQSPARDGEDALATLRDHICMGMGTEEKVSWYVVICGDEERSWSAPSTPMADNRRSGGTWFDDNGMRSVTPGSSTHSREPRSREGRDISPPQKAQKRSASISRGLKKLFRRNRSVSDLKKSSSVKSLQNLVRAEESPPPLPGSAL